LDSLKEPHAAVHAFALTRVLEVAAGTAAGILVNLASAWTVRPRIQGAQHFFARSVAADVDVWQPAVARHALLAGGVLALLPLLTPWLSAGALTQAAITIMAVMTVPLAALGGDASVVGTRVAHRFLGCALGALAAAFALFVSRHHVPTAVALLCIGVWAGRHIENSGMSFAYVGTQFALVFLVVFVPDDYHQLGSAPGWERLSGIVLGIALLLPARAVAQQLKRRG
ncbi:MAG: FUSC family protein, partial [Stenotrophomonas sp.]